MKTYDFSQVIDRRGTCTYKYGELVQDFGRDDLLPLWIADMDFPVCPEIAEAIHCRTKHPIYGYTMPPESYWQSIIDWQRERNGFEMSREEMCFIGGIVAGFGLVVNHFTHPGDKIVIQEPVYHPFKRVITGNGRIPVNNALLETEDGFYRMDLEGLEKIFAAEKPRLMVVCNPHNPIGIAWDAASLKQVAALAHRYGVVLFSDEIHGDLTIFGHKHTPLASVSEEAAAVTVTMGAPSKTFNIAGLKSSWCVIKNEELRKQFYHWLETNELCSPHLMALVATEAAYRNGAEWLAQCLRYIEDNILFVESFCKENIPGIVAIRPQASFLVWLDCSGLGLCNREVNDLFINSAHLALNDGEMFGAEGRCHMRLNVGTPRCVLEQAMNQLAQAVRERKPCK